MCIGDAEAEERLGHGIVRRSVGAGLRREVGLEAGSRRTRSVALVGVCVESLEDWKELIGKERVYI